MMRFWHRRKNPDVTTGALYGRSDGGKVVETARVLSISFDVAGIPHVRFSLHHERSEASDELRILCLRSFQEQFRERLSV